MQVITPRDPPRGILRRILQGILQGILWRILQGILWDRPLEDPPKERLQAFSENFWEFSGEDLYSVDDSERFRRFLEAFGRVRMHSDAFGSFWKLPEIFVLFFLYFSDVCVSKL